MSDQDIFTPPVEQVDTPVQQNADLNTILDGIVNAEGKRKYADPAAALKSIPHKEQHISKLEQELADVRAELAKRASVEEVIAKVIAEGKPDTPKAELAAADIERIIEQKTFEVLSKSQQEQAGKANRKAVSEVLMKQFGSADAAQKAVQAKADELGLSVQDIQRLATTSPRAVLAYFNAQSVDVPAKPAAGARVPATPAPVAKQFSALNHNTTQSLVHEWNRHKKTGV